MQWCKHEEEESQDTMNNPSGTVLRLGEGRRDSSVVDHESGYGVCTRRLHLRKVEHQTTLPPMMLQIRFKRWAHKAGRHVAQPCVSRAAEDKTTRRNVDQVLIALTSLAEAIRSTSRGSNMAAPLFATIDPSTTNKKVCDLVADG